MTKFIHEIDIDGFYIQSIVLNPVDVIESNPIYEYPTHYTLVAPPTETTPFYRAKWNGEKWIEGTTQSEIDVITGNTFELAKKAKIQALNNDCNKTVLGRFKATIDNVEYEFSYDYDAQLRFTGIGVLFNADKINEIEWTAYQNNERVRIMLNQDNFDVVTLVALLHQNSNIVKYNQLLQRVNDATTKEQIEAVVW